MQDCGTWCLGAGNRLWSCWLARAHRDSGGLLLRGNAHEEAREELAEVADAVHAAQAGLLHCEQLCAAAGCFLWARFPRDGDDDSVDDQTRKKTQKQTVTMGWSGKMATRNQAGWRSVMRAGTAARAVARTQSTRGRRAREAVSGTRDCSKETSAMALSARGRSARCRNTTRAWCGGGHGGNWLLCSAHARSTATRKPPAASGTGSAGAAPRSTPRSAQSVCASAVPGATGSHRHTRFSATGSVAASRLASIAGPRASIAARTCPCCCWGCCWGCCGKDCGGGYGWDTGDGERDRGGGGRGCAWNAWATWVGLGLGLGLGRGFWFGFWFGFGLGLGLPPGPGRGPGTNFGLFLLPGPFLCGSPCCPGPCCPGPGPGFPCFFLLLVIHEMTSTLFFSFLFLFFLSCKS